MRNQKQHIRDGATTIEFVFVAIPMFLMVFACIEFARVGMIEGMAEDAAYAAARHVMVAGAAKSEGVEEGERLLALVGATGTVDVVPRNSSDTVQDEINDNTDSITVTVTVPMSENTLFLSVFTGNITIQRTCTMFSERYEGFYDGGDS